jgi:hypothetical protein
MRNLTDFAIRHEYERIKELRDRLVKIGNKINWDDFRLKLDILFCNNTECVERPNIDVIVMRFTAFQMSSLKENWLISFHSECSLEQHKSFLIPPRYGNSESALLIAKWLRKFGTSCKSSLMP